MKLVINSCYGGFHLSPKALKRYLELKGKNAYFYKQTKYEYRDGIYEFTRIDDIDAIKSSLFIYCTTIDYGKVTNTYPSGPFADCPIKRNDKHLIQTIEELGEEANTTVSRLTIVEIENGRWYKINEYDGYESIEYRDIDDEWELAEDDEYERF